MDSSKPDSKTNPEFQSTDALHEQAIYHRGRAFKCGMWETGEVDGKMKILLKIEDFGTNEDFREEINQQKYFFFWHKRNKQSEMNQTH